MPEKKPIERVRQDEREGKALSTQAGVFVREEIELIREGAHGARSTKQAIAIGLSKARRAGVKLPPPKKGTVPEETREKAKRDLEKAQEGGAKTTSRKRSQTTLKAFKREGRAAASKQALSKPRARSLAAMAVRARCGNCVPRRGSDSRRIIARPHAIRQIHAAGEPLQGTVLPRSPPRGNAVFPET